MILCFHQQFKGAYLIIQWYPDQIMVPATQHTLTHTAYCMCNKQFAMHGANIVMKVMKVTRYY